MGVPARFINEPGLEKVMFEAADPEVFPCTSRREGVPYDAASRAGTGPAPGVEPWSPT